MASDLEANVAALASRHLLPRDSTPRLLALLEQLESDSGAPTGVRDPAAAVNVHLADSLVALEVDAVREARVVADLGAGAGFPGLPLAIALPDALVSLLESTGHKAQFIERAAAAARIENARAVPMRAEEWSEGLGACDVTCARALGRLDVVLEYAAPLLRLGGTAVAWKGRREAGEEHAGATAAEELGLEAGPVLEVRPWPAAENRHLYLYRKVRPTPEGFPRRPGRARKRPLGGPPMPVQAPDL